MKVSAYILAIGLAVFSACAPKPEVVTNDVVKGHIAYQLMAENNYYGGPFGEGSLILDKEYGLPTKAWIESYFYPKFWAKHSSKYQSESNDCDDFAGAARSFSQELNNATPNVGKRALAFGELHYVKDMGPNKDGVHHAINFAIVKKDDKLDVIFFEPQNGFVIKLNEAEKASIYVWIM